jgi:hypothetical protein
MGERFIPGTETWYASDSPTCNFSAIFEDDGDTGYFYAYDRSASADPILDAVQIYNVESVLDRDIESIVEIIWAPDGMKAVVFLNDCPHAVIDFAKHCSYCRTSFPDPPKNWQRGKWHDDLMKIFYGKAE